jgi:hypothetical protein
MTEMVIAVFETASAADAAVQDLDVARIPSAVIRRGMRDDRVLPDNQSTSSPQSKRGYGLSSVTVAVDEIHAAAVTGILNQYAPLEIEERSDHPAFSF